MSLAYFPMYPDDFEADTAHLTLAEDGAYNRLLRLCWRTPGCSLPADRSWIYRRARAMSDEDRAVIDTVLDEFFMLSDGRVSNARLSKEWLAANEAHERRKNAGSKGGKAKSLKNKETAPSNAVAKPKQPEPEPEPEEKTEANASDGQAVEHDDFAKQLWDRGVAFLRRHSVPERQARAVIGKWRKAHNDTDIFDAFAACSKAGAVDPVPWITARLTGGEKGAKDGKPSRGASKLTAFVGGAAGAPGMDWGQDCHPSRPLLARG